MVTLDDFDLQNQLASYLGYEVEVCFRTSSGGIITHTGTLEMVNRWHVKIHSSTRSGFHFKIPTKYIRSIKPLDPFYSPHSARRESQINMKGVV